MRIAVISLHGCPCIPPGGVDAGGMNVYVRETSKLLSNWGHHVTVYSRLHSGAGADVEESGELMGAAKLFHIPAGDPSMGKNDLPAVLGGFAAKVAAAAMSERETFDLIASHYWLSGVAGVELAHRWRAPHVLSFHTIAQMKTVAFRGSAESEERLRTEPELARSADSVVAWTEEEATFIASTFDVSRKKVEVIPPGVDTAIFRPSDRSSLPVEYNPEHGPIIVYVGRLDELKGIDLAIESLAEILKPEPDAVLKVVGGGSDEEWARVRNLAEKCGVVDAVEFLGVAPQRMLTTIYSQADVIVAPSYHETFGMAVLEAASCGVPAVAAEVDGLRSIVVEGKTGFLVSKRSPEIYAENVLKILQDEDLKRKMSFASRERALNLNWQASVSGLVRLYKNIACA